MNMPSVPIGELGEVMSGSGFPIRHQGAGNGTIPFAKVGDISRAKASEGKTISIAENSVSEAVLRELRARAFPAGSIVFAKIGEAIRKNNRCITTRPMAFDNNVMGIRFDDAKIDTNYAYRFLETKDFRSLANSTTVPSIRKTDMEALKILLPPLAEQKRIGAILDQADALRRLRHRAIDRLNALGQAIFQEMFVDQPDYWRSVKIDEVISNARTGPFGSQLLHSEFVDAGIPVLGIDNVVSNEFVWAEPRFITPEKYRGLRRYTVAPGDVLITIMGTCGRCAIVPDNIPIAINTKHICCLTPDRTRVTSEYLRAAFLMHPLVLRQLGVEAKGAVMPGLNMGIIKKTEIPLPPLDLQFRFGERIGRILRQDRDTRRQAISLDSLFASLQHRAFTGQL